MTETHAIDQTEIDAPVSAGEAVAPILDVAEDAPALDPVPVELASDPEVLREHPEPIAAEDGDDDPEPIEDAQPVPEVEVEEDVLPIAAAEPSTPAPDQRRWTNDEAAEILRRADAATDRIIAEHMPELERLFLARMAAADKLIAQREATRAALAREAAILAADNRAELEFRQRRARELSESSRPKRIYSRGADGRYQRSPA